MTPPESSPTTAWPFLTAHARVLACILRNPTITMKKMAAEVEVSERYVQTLLVELRAAGYLEVRREGRKKRYEVRFEKKLRHPRESHRTVAELAEFAEGWSAA